MTIKEFSDGWKHFCDCIDFARSSLDAEAIRFMNEMPAAVFKGLIVKTFPEQQLRKAKEKIVGYKPDRKFINGIEQPANQKSSNRCTG